MREKRQGFTLIELLVVIAIIAILAAILFPVFARARENARKATCQSNLKQIATAALMYGQDYDEWAMGWNQGGNCTASSRTGGWPEHALVPYVKNSQVFMCPNRRFTGNPGCGNFAPWAQTLNLGSSYGWNCRGLGNGRGTAMAQILKPADLIWFGDGGNPWRIWKRSPEGCGAAYTSDATEPHSEGRNVAFCDGHVKWVKSTRLYADSQALYDGYLPWANKDVVAPGW